MNKESGHYKSSHYVMIDDKYFWGWGFSVNRFFEMENDRLTIELDSEPPPTSYTKERLNKIIAQLKTEVNHKSITIVPVTLLGRSYFLS